MTPTVHSGFPAEALPQLHGWLTENAAQMIDDFSPQTPETVEAMWRESENRGKVYTARLADNIIGVVWGEHLGDGQYLGHLVFDRAGVTSAQKLTATRLALARWFREGARKISWQVFPENRPFLIFLRRLGASEEGRLRAGTRRSGHLTDVILMASFPEVEACD